MKRYDFTSPLALLALLVALSTGCVQVYGPPATAADKSTTAGGEGGDGKTAGKGEKDGEKGPFKPWDEVLKDTEALDGFLETHLKRDQSLHLELAAGDLDRDFGLVMHYSRGTGVFNLHDGLALGGTHLMRFRRVGDTIYLVRRNPLFRADPGTPMAVSLEDNVGHSVVAAFKIESENEESGNVLVDVSPFLISDYPDIARRLKPYYGDKPVAADKERSFVSGRRAFPKNLEIDVELTFTSGEPPQADSAGVSDPRSVPVGVRYSLFALPEEPMRPRLADDRVGFFLHAVEDFSRDSEESGYVRYVQRWRLEKKDPTAELSAPVQPIVYYVDRSVPGPYRRYVAEGIEAWNKAFEAAGFQGAIVARDAPDDPEWSAEDIRYSTVRWTAAHEMGYAIGPSQTDPRTGEILNADILVSSVFVRGWLFDYQELADPAALVRRHFEMERAFRSLDPGERERLCMAAAGRLHQLATQRALLVGLGVLDGGEPMPEEYLGDAIRDLVMHEVGHTLGLRHNFKSSAGVPVERLHDTDFTGRNGVTLSVMDYAPVNVATDPSRQGHYWNRTVGSYDRWAIRYGYAPVYEQEGDGPFVTSGTPVGSLEAERAGLDKLARQAADPLHIYGTDEDNWLGPWAVDPLTSAWDLGADPLAFAEQRTALVERVKPNLEERLIQEGEGYQRLRAALGSVTFAEWVGLLTATRTVGGLHFARDHKGDPGQRPPFTPVSAGDQRRAVELIAGTAFAEGAFHLPPEMLNKMAPNRWAHWGMDFFSPPIDVPVHDLVLFLQATLLDQLIHPARLARVLDNEVRMPEGQEPYRLAEMLATLSGSIWSELSGSPRDIGSFRRNLQRVHVDRLSSLLLAEGSEESPPVPPDARALARHELAGLGERIGGALAAGGSLDVYTRAHLEETLARIERALEASVTLAVG